ncbi:hypothetical protein BGP78_10365 [Pseudoalteromonas sp. MSK9-3]|uniref:hypothetical protein n=1 Tax=Pseudoalteromonas sp. MSK9-3 TaxID=1897633 RepID=UPI000E6BEC39|nr:hypothetical protein [Pseudoalteromonas sp. MSK9-3]RJE76806.1 hypothetical protein BGP78_10365 [Pseudoalteromonas sp. MSK9-3]
MPSIKCKCCGYKEEANKEFFFKVLGSGMVGFGGDAWVTYLFAGTEFAFALCVAIVSGGVIVLAFSDQITKWVSENLDRRKCIKKSMGSDQMGN